MRRYKQLLSFENTEEILKNNTSGTLALIDHNQFPYAVPLSYVYEDGKIYFHSAKQGHKIDAINYCEKASFCVIDQDEVHGEELTTYYKSVIAFGTIHLASGQEKIDGICKLGLRFCDDMTFIEHEIEKFKDAFEVLVLHIDHMTGKQAKELL